MSVPVCIGLGSNMGDRLGFLAGALASLAEAGTTIEAVSRVWEGDFVGPGRQERYLNACVRVGTGLTPMALLELMQGIERAAGRRPASHMAPRPLDLDLILYGDRVLDGPQLCVPHPRARQRAFVLEPLSEVAPALLFPDSGETVTAACAKIRGTEGPWLRVREDMSLACGRADRQGGAGCCPGGTS